MLVKSKGYLPGWQPKANFGIRLDGGEIVKDLDYPLFNPKTLVAIDTETTGVDVWGRRNLNGVWCEDMPFAVSMCDEEGNGWYCEWPVNPFTREVTPNPKDVEFIRRTILGFVPNEGSWHTKPREIIFHNSKFDCRMLAKVGVDVVALVKQARGKIHDTLFQARVCFTLELDYGLKPLSKRYLGIDDADEKDLQAGVISARRKLSSYNIRAAKHNKPFMIKDESPKADYWLPSYFASQDDDDNYTEIGSLCKKYCMLDTFRTIGLHMFYHGIMEEDEWLLNKYHSEMRNIWPIVNSMEARGMRVFPDAIREEGQKCLEDMGYFHSDPNLCQTPGCCKPLKHDGTHSHLANMQLIIQEQGLLHLPPEKMTPPVSKRPRKVAWTVPAFNPSSPPQLMRVMYLPKGEGGLGLPGQFNRKKTKTSDIGTRLTADKDALRELMYEPFIRELAGYRAAKHTKGLFFDKFAELMKPDTTSPGCWVVHPGLNQCGTKTGRFSCNDPNLQQVSAGGKKSLSATYSSTKVFGPRPGYVWLGFDYSQQEVRLFAFLAQVPVMLQAIADGTDPFRAMADEAWGGIDNPNSVKAVIQALDLFRDPANDAVKAAQLELGWLGKHRRTVSPNDPQIHVLAQKWLAKYNYSIVAAEASLEKESSRQRCKHITYAKIFGGGPGSYTHLLYCSLEEAKIFDEEYNASMPEMKAYMKGLEKKAKRDGYIINLYDRKLRVDRNFAYRGVSYMIQGSAADMMKTALIKVSNYLKRLKYCDAHLVITIHDELKIEVRESHATDSFIKAIIRRMEDTDGRVGVPTPVECTITRDRWGVNEEKWKPHSMTTKTNSESSSVTFRRKARAFSSIVKVAI